MYTLVDLKKNLMIFSSYLNENFKVVDDEILFNIRDSIFALNKSIIFINNMFLNYNSDELDETLFFLQKKVSDLKIEILLKKELDNNSKIELQINLLELELEHCILIVSNITRLKNKEIICNITPEHIEKFFAKYGIDDMYALFCKLMLDEFTFILNEYLKTGEYEIFDKEIAFFFLQKEIKNKHMIFLEKVWEVQHPIFIKQIEKELLELEKKEIKEMQEFEQLFYFFQKKHLNNLVEVLIDENKVAFDVEHITLFHKNILLLKQKNYISYKNIPIIFMIKNHIQNFRMLLDKMFIKKNDGHVVPALDNIEDVFLYRIKYFTELENWIKLLPVVDEEELIIFLKEKFEKTQEKLSKNIFENFEMQILEAEIEHYVILIKVTKTRVLEIHKNFLLLDEVWWYFINEKRIYTYLFDFLEILIKMKKMGTMQTEKGQSVFYECQKILNENCENWKNVWKIKKIADLQKNLEDTFTNWLRICELTDKLDQLFLKIIKKHFEIILKEIKQKEEEKDFLIIDFSYIQEFLDEFVMIKKADEKK